MDGYIGGWPVSTLLAFGLTVMLVTTFITVQVIQFRQAGRRGKARRPEADNPADES